MSSACPPPLDGGSSSHDARDLYEPFGKTVDVLPSPSDDVKLLQPISESECRTSEMIDPACEIPRFVGQDEDVGSYPYHRGLLFL